MGELKFEINHPNQKNNINYIIAYVFYPSGIAKT